MENPEGKAGEAGCRCREVAGEGCGLKKVLGLVGGPWKVLILCVLNEIGEPVRYSVLRKGIYGITSRMLASSLRELESDGLVIRRQYMAVPLWVEYEVSPKEKTLVPILMELGRWGRENL